ncbi:S1/P1 nuclease [Mucilaginibacter sp. 21P]|uniref:S1/P1 nuclease n=1 Tax=Mucilaginibacter sp. 21P TaxID=2778902 RepID=UPI001C575979|nr:S1/P1 nuclease [Mucilaginibacter sp. 21P]QXV63653.1 S1/P1 nuclease [Mucilaginibacter sp. 21P]
MKRSLLFIAAISGILTLASWGYIGHRAIAMIAQKHLSSNTAYVVSAYLKGDVMSDVATWADEHRDPKTASWHYLNLPSGLDHDAFVKAVIESDDNVYTAILKTEASIKDKNVPANAKNEALKYLIHLIGDAHQPMHVSRKEDKGGNTIQVRYDDKGTNLHSLWDSKLIEHEGLTEQEILKRYDNATAAEIRKWQSDSPVEWLWESYQISAELYTLTKSGKTINDAYYQKYIQVVHHRIVQAGIRLAGELNKLLNNANPPAADLTIPAENNATQAVADRNIALKNIAGFVGQRISTSGKVYSLKDIGSMVLVNLGGAYPNQLLTLALKGKAKALGLQLADKTITVTGDVVNYKGKPEIVVSDPGNIKIR